MKLLLIVLFTIIDICCVAQSNSDYLTLSEIKSDLIYLDELLQEKSSYQGLNGFDYKSNFKDFLLRAEKESVTKQEFEQFLSRTIGKIGDRHAYIKGERVRDSLYFPIAFAPYNKGILAIEYNSSKREYDFFDSGFPYLKLINHIPLRTFLSKISPGDILAPSKSYLLRVVRELRDIDKIYQIQNSALPNPTIITLTNEAGLEKEVTIKLVPRNKRARYWDERFYRKIYRLKEEQYNDTIEVDRFFRIEDNIGYIQIADMVSRDECPLFFESLNTFMTTVRHCDALIIDIRDNSGGTREIIEELGGYFVHPDSIYVVNTTKQRGVLPLNDELKHELQDRYLFSKSELDQREQNAVDRFMVSFEPMYYLDSTKFSEYHYHVFNGQKLSKDKFHYNKPIYILVNERSFSAASILASVFKHLPNIKTVGVNTDGSSGNSVRFELPNSGLRGKISTMVSYQKDGKILDGIGTAPDIIIERNLDQIFWREDYQLNKLIDLIKTK